MTACTFPGCGGEVRAKGLCSSHHNQKRKGHPLSALRARSDHARPVLWLRVEPAVREAAMSDPDGARSALTRWAKRRAGV